MHQILNFFQPFQERAQSPPPIQKGHCCVNVTTSTTPKPALHYPPLQQCCSNDVVVFLQATTGELLPTFCEEGVIYSIPYCKGCVPGCWEQTHCQNNNPEMARAARNLWYNCWSSPSQWASFHFQHCLST